MAKQTMSEISNLILNSVLCSLTRIAIEDTTCEGRKGEGGGREGRRGEGGMEGRGKEEREERREGSRERGVDEGV